MVEYQTALPILDIIACIDVIQGIMVMATITIRNLDDELKSRLRIVAAQNGHSMEEEVRVILRSALKEREPESTGLGSRIRAHFGNSNGMELSSPDRTDRPRAPNLSE